MDLKFTSSILKIFFTIIGTSIPYFFSSIDILLILFAASWIVVLLCPRINWFLLFIGPCGYTILYFFLTAAFSPDQSSGLQFWPFSINEVGILNAIRAALRVGTSQLVALAYIWSTSITETYATVNKFPMLGCYARDLFRAFQLIIYDIDNIALALWTRGFRAGRLLRALFNFRWQILYQQMIAGVATVNSLVPRLLQHIQNGTYVRSAKTQKVEVQVISGDTTVSLRDISIRYNRIGSDIISNCSFELHAGECILIVGADKAGKSTLLKAISGYIPCITGYLRGQISILGKNAALLSITELSSLVTLSQSDMQQQFLGLTIGEELLLRAGSIDIAQAAANQFGILEIWHQDVTRLSGGQQARLRLAGVFASGVSVILLDRPFDHLDPEGRDILVKTVREWKNLGKTIVFVDPRVAEVLDIVDRVLVVQEGLPVNEIEKSLLDNAAFLKANGCLFDFQKWSRPHQLNPEKSVATLNDVAVRRGGRVILAGISLKLRAGECLLIKGSNGSGKTTLMQVISGAIRVSEGVVEVVENVGYVGQDPMLQTLCTKSYTEVTLTSYLRAQTLNPAEVTELLKWAGLSGDESTFSLHSKDLKLLAISAVRKEAALMIFDEPTSGVDADTSQKIYELICNLLSNGVAVIIISHDKLYESIADVIKEIRGGHLLDV